MMRLLQLRPEGPGKVQLWVVRLFMTRSLDALIVHWMATPSGVTLAPGICLMHDGDMGIAQQYLTSLSNALSKAASFSVGVVADLWLPQDIW